MLEEGKELTSGEKGGMSRKRRELLRKVGIEPGKPGREGMNMAEKVMKSPLYKMALLTNTYYDMLTPAERRKQDLIEQLVLTAQSRVLGPESLSRLEKDLALQGGIKVEELYRERANIDGLTGLWNRRKFKEILDTEVARAKRTGRQVALLMLDIDNFKSVNDKLGHETGDKVLKAVAEVLKANVRRTDVAGRWKGGVPGRWGGEEFLVLLTGVKRREEGTNGTLENEPVAIVGERIRQVIKEINREGDVLPDEMLITVSIGGTYLNEDEIPEALIERADNALYDAKRGGKDQVWIDVEGESQKVETMNFTETENG